jgi:hypothetical protein
MYGLANHETIGDYDAQFKEFIEDLTEFGGPRVYRDLVPVQRAMPL